MVTKVMLEVVPTKKSRSRNWTDMEVNLFASVLVDEKYEFAASLENLSVHKSTNKEVFRYVKEVFDEAIRDAKLNENNMVKHFPKEDEVSNFEPLDTSADKLRKKYNNLKAEWRKRTDQAKRMGGIYLDREPRWFILLNAVFSAASQISNVVYHPVSFLYDTDQKEFSKIDKKHLNEEKYSIYEDRHPTMINSKEFYPIEHNHVQLIPQQKPSPLHRLKEPIAMETNTCRTKTVETKKPNERLKKKRINFKSCHRHRKLPNRQLESLTRSVQELAASLIEIKKIAVENELRRDQMFFNFFATEAEKNRSHELRLAELQKECPCEKQSITVTAPATKHLKPQRRSMLVNHTRSSECMIPIRVAVDGEAVVSSSSTISLQKDAFYPLSPDENT